MEKTKFKLNYIYSHVKRSHLFKTSQKKRSSKAHPNSNIETSFPILKFFKPKTIYRTKGGLCILDEAPFSEEYVSFLALQLNFMQIKEIRVTTNFIICSLEDYGQPYDDVSSLSEKLMSIGNQYSYDLALRIQKYVDRFAELDIVGKRDIPGMMSEIEFFNRLTENQHEPLLIFDHKRDSNGQFILSKLRVNKFMKEMTAKNDFQLFQEGLILIPCKEYFPFMKEFLDGCFHDRNHLFKLHLNTNQGVLLVYAFVYQFGFDEELITVWTFPKTEQSPNVQKLYDITNKKLKDRKEMREPRTLPKKIEKMDDWDQFVKQYYEPWLSKEGKIRCSFKKLDVDQ